MANLECHCSSKDKRGEAVCIIVGGKDPPVGGSATSYGSRGRSEEK